MNRSTTLTASDAVANVEAYLAAQYAKRHVPEPQRVTVQRHPMDGVVVFVVSFVVAMVLVGMGE